MTAPPGPAGPGYLLLGPRSLDGVKRFVAYACVAAVGFLVTRFVVPRLPALPGALDAFPHPSHWFLGLAAVVLAVTAVTRWLRRPVLLRVGPDGVEYEHGTLPWASLWQVVVLHPEARAGAFDTDLPPQVGFRLKRGAPLPRGLTTLITDPRRPLEIPDGLRTHVTSGRIDARAVHDAVRRCAPPEVLLVEQHGGRDQVLPR